MKRLMNSTAVPVLAGLGMVLCASACTDEDDGEDETGIMLGDGDGDGSGDGDGDGAGDGDGDGDGDGSGDGDGDGDGDGAGDGDGDGDGVPGDGDGDGDGDCDGTSPYQGGWEIGCCQDEMTPTPYQPGQIGPGSVLPDWTLTDAYGDQVRFYDFCHDAIYYELTAHW